MRRRSRKRTARIFLAGLLAIRAWHHSRGDDHRMFARLITDEYVDLVLADRVRDWMEAVEADPFRELPGYRGSITLVDRDNARLVGIGFYASAGQAQEAEALLATMYEQAKTQLPGDIRPALDMQPESVGLYVSPAAVGVPNWVQGVMPPPTTLFDWQWQFWITDDILHALAEVFGPETEQS